jgi:DNA primase
MLAEKAGIQLEQTPRPKAAPGSVDDKNTLFKVLEWCEQQFHDYFLRGSEAEIARRYVAERGITAESIKKWRIGFAPDQWQWLLDRAAKTQFTPAMLEAVGMIGKSEKNGKYWERFRGRVIFPIHDTQYRPIAFGGRVLPQLAAREEADTGRKPAKYVNSPETRLYSKSEQLYGLEIARDAAQKTPDRSLIVTEGYTDVILAHQGGVDNAVACCGTALGERHLPLIRRFAQTVYLVLDGDEAGQRRMNEIIQLFIFAPLDLRILVLPEGLDPADFVLTRGGDAFKSLLPTAVDGIDHRISVETAGIDLVRDTFRANRALENILQFVARAPRAAAATPESIRLRATQIVTRLARDFQLDAADLRARLNELRRGERSPTAPPATTDETATQVHQNLRAADLDHCERELIEILTQHPDLTEKAALEVAVDGFQSLAARQIYGVFVQLAQDGSVPEFGRVLAAIDDPALKSLLVELDERASAKAAHALEDGFAQLASVCKVLRDREQQLQRRAKLAALQDGRVDAAEQNATFLQLFAAKREQQGISDSTDG